MTTAQEKYAAMLKNAISPALRDLGFRGTAGRYEAPSESTWMLLGFQKSDYSDRSTVQFTVNVSVIPKTTWNEMRQQRPNLPERPSPSTFYGTWATQKRIGELLADDDGDKWWTVRANEGVDRVVEDVMADIRHHVVPWMKAEASAQAG